MKETFQPAPMYQLIIHTREIESMVLGEVCEERYVEMDVFRSASLGLSDVCNSLARIFKMDAEDITPSGNLCFSNGKQGTFSRRENGSHQHDEKGSYLTRYFFTMDMVVELNLEEQFNEILHSQLQ